MLGTLSRGGPVLKPVRRSGRSGVNRMLHLAVLLTAIVMVACSPSTASRPGAGPGNERPTGSGTKAVVIGMDEDIANLWDTVQSGGGTGAREMANIVNQHLVAITNDGSPTPRLLAEL